MLVSGWDLVHIHWGKWYGVQYLYTESLNSLENCLKAYIYFSAFQHDVNIMNFSIFMQSIRLFLPHSSWATSMNWAHYSRFSLVEWTELHTFWRKKTLYEIFEWRCVQQAFLAKKTVPLLLKVHFIFRFVLFIFSFDLHIFCITVTSWNIFPFNFSKCHVRHLPLWIVLDHGWFHCLYSHTMRAHRLLCDTEYFMDFRHSNEVNKTA